MAISNISNVLNTKLRMSGMVSGLDTDSMVQKLMSIEKMKVDKAKQSRQLLEWKRDEYRSIINNFKNLRDSYMDVLSATNMKSTANYKVYGTSATDSSYVTAAANADAAAGAHSVEIIDLATAATNQSTAVLTKDIQGSGGANFGSANGKSFVMNLDGLTKTINIDAGITNIATLQQAVNNAFGAGKIQITDAGGGALKFVTAGGASKLALSAGTTDALGDLGFAAGDNKSNRLDLSDTLDTIKDKFKGGAFAFTALADGSDGLKITVNTKTFEFKKTTTLGSMLSQISSDATANINIQYNEITDKFELKAKQYGTGNTLDISETGSSFLAKAGIDNANVQAGTDLSAKVDGEVITRSANTFTVSGITYTALKKTTSAQTITVNQDVDAVYNKIKNFITKYNETIDSLYKKTTEKTAKGYSPLTDDQKDAMKDDDIKNWEAKAKLGLLKNDSVLNKAYSEMRRASYELVSGVSDSLASIGISTSSYKDYGKLTINEEKLKDAIRTNPDKVTNLFAKESNIAYSRDLSLADRTTRFNESGFVVRLYDVIQDNISTMRDSSGNKGFLLQKAGLEGDASEYDNQLTKLLLEQDNKIDDLNDMLTRKENDLYKKFTAMETALNSMNSQSSWLSQQFGGGQ